MDWLASVPVAPVVDTPVRTPITLLPRRSPSAAWTTTSSTRLLNQTSPFRLSPMRTTFGSGILVVDDEPNILAIVTDVLTSEGYGVLQATNGAEALAVLDRNRLSLVLLDMRMPVLDGWGFARAVLARRVLLPILVMTAAVDGKRWADQIGAAGCVSKPFDIPDLLADVERLVPPPLGGAFRHAG